MIFSERESRLTKKLVWRRTATGELEGVDPSTGAVVEVQKSKKRAKAGARKVAGGPGAGRPSKNDKTQTHHWIVGPNGSQLWVPKGTNPDELPQKIWPFAQVTADAICTLVTSGKTITKIGAMQGFPTADVIWKWKREHPEFAAALKEARIARAEYFHDKAIDAAEMADKDEVQVARLQVEAYKWGAEVGDRESFGKSTKLTGDANNPVTFLVDTGIRREPIEIPSTTDEESSLPARSGGQP